MSIYTRNAILYFSRYVYRCPSSGGGVVGNGSTFCGSNFDNFGNARFADWRAQRAVMWSEGRNFGITTFDDILRGFVTIFQCITLEGWVDVMYMYADGVGWTIAPIMFVLMIIMGAFFLLNLTLAVLGNHFDAKMLEIEEARVDFERKTHLVNVLIRRYRKRLKMKKKVREIELAAEKAMAMQAQGESLPGSPVGDGGPSAFSSFLGTLEVTVEDEEGLAKNACTRFAEGGGACSGFARLVGRIVDNVKRFLKTFAAKWNHDLSHVWCQRCTILEEKEGCPAQFGRGAFNALCAFPIKCIHTLVNHWTFQLFIIACILLNSLTLSLDIYPPNTLLESGLEIVNFFLTVVFVLEMILKLYGLGLRVYLHDGFNVFDAVIVGASILETAVAPPSFFKIGTSSDSGFGGLTALRTFRVFRLFKLARSWKALQQILATIVRALQSGVYFLILLMLFILIYALVGQQFFANRLHFDANTLDALKFENIPSRYSDVRNVSFATTIERDYAVGLVDATIYTPRSNFDTLNHAIFTIVQVLSGENWNVLLYDCWRASDPVTACTYLFSLVCIGSFVLLDFFLAILLNDFEKSALLAEKEKEEEEKARLAAGKELPCAKFSDMVSEGWTKAVHACDDLGARMECRKPEVHVDKMDPLADAALARTRKETPKSTTKRTDEEIMVAAMVRVQNMLRKKKAMAKLEGLRRRALFRGEDVTRVIENAKPIIIEGERVCCCFGRSIRIYFAMFLEYSAADIHVFRLREGDRVVTDLEHCGGILDTTYARILRIHNSDDIAVGTRFDIETLTWTSQMADELLATYGSHELTFTELRQLLPRDITDDDFQRLCEMADEDNSKTIDGMELATLLESIRGIEVRSLTASQLKWEFCPSCASFLRAITFDNFVLLLIFFSSALLAIESPLWDPKSDQQAVLKWMDFCINILFTLEIVLKVIAYGFMRHKSAYFRNWWNVGDFIIVIISWSTFALSEVKELKALRSVRLLRVLRTLRSINKLPGLKRVVNGLLLSIIPLTSVLPVILLIFLIFAIVLTSSLKGSLSHCTGDGYAGLTAFQQDLIFNPVEYSKLSAVQAGWATGEYAKSHGMPTITSKPVCEWLGGDWEAKVSQSFDNTVLSFSALLQLSTTEGWTDVAFAAVDSRGIEMQPESIGGINEEVWLYVFIIFEAVGAFFLVNLFIGILIVTFAAAKADRERGGEGSSFLMSPAQVEYMRKRNTLEEELKPMHAIRMLDPRLPFQKVFYDLVERWQLTIEVPLKCNCVVHCAKSCPKHSVRQCCGRFYRILQCVDCKSVCPRIKVALTFDTIIFICIIANTVVMAITYFGEPEYYTMTLSVLNWAFAIIFTIEAAVKLIGYGICGYFMQPWNTFDFVIVLGTAIGLGMSVGKDLGILSLDIDIGPAATVIRSFRVARMIRLVRFAKPLRIIVDTLVAALPAMLNVSLLVMLVFFIYTVIGVQVFAKVGFQEDGALGEHANFMSFGTGILTLFRCSTGEAWPDLMYDMASGPEQCVVDPEYDSAKCGMATPPFKEGCEDINGCGDPFGARAFHFSFQIVCGFIMLNLIIFYVLDSFNNMNMNAHGLEVEDHKLLLETWLRFDTTCVGHIELEKLIDMLRVLPAPMGFGQDVQETAAKLYNSASPEAFVAALKHEVNSVPQLGTHGYTLAPALCACCCGEDDRAAMAANMGSSGFGKGSGKGSPQGRSSSKENSSRGSIMAGLSVLRKETSKKTESGGNVKVSRRQVLKQIVQVMKIPAVPSLQYSRGVYLLYVPSPTLDYIF